LIKQLNTTLITFCALVLFSCTNGAGVVGKANSTTSNLASNTSGDNLTGSVPTITRIIIDPVNPGTFDLEGDGSSAIGNVCTASATTSTTTTTTTSTDYQGAGTSSCQCYYQYTVPSTGAQEAVYVNTSYFEANMVSCPYSTIEAGVTSVNVSLYVTSSSLTSTPAISVPLTGSTSAFDTTNSNNFTSIQRYQCKDVVSIFMPWSGSGSGTAGANAMYDPFQSDAPDTSYPLNFYTGNFGATFSYFSGAASSSVGNWNCPGVPNDTSVPGLDLRVWSVGPDSAGSSQIYPAVGSAFDRSTFYTANQASGIFSVPLNTYIAPTLYGQPGGTGSSAPSGYGATPNFVSSTQETCGDGTTDNIPAGFKWAKLWLFRADLAPRYYRTSSVIASVNIACNPGVDSSNSVAFPACFNGHTYNAGVTAQGGYKTSTSAFTTDPSTYPLADRIFTGEGSTASGNAMCFNFDGWAGAGEATYSGCASGIEEAPGCETGTETTAVFGAGTDHYAPPVFATTSTLAATYEGPGKVDPLNLLTATTGQYVPKDMNPTSVDLDLNNPRYDFLYVVTPVTVMAYQMENTASSANYPYTPYRFPSKQDCQSSNPNNPAFSGDCNPSKIIHYGLKLHDISTNGDPGNTTSNLVYPMCVLQPI
jgi:hypothetical protein